MLSNLNEDLNSRFTSLLERVQTRPIKGTNGVYVLSTEGKVFNTAYNNREVKPCGKKGSGIITIGYIIDGKRVKKNHRLGSLMLDTFPDLLYVRTTSPTSIYSGAEERDPSTSALYCHHIDGDENNYSINNIMFIPRATKIDYIYKLYEPSRESDLDKVQYFTSYYDASNKTGLSLGSLHILLHDPEKPAVIDGIYNEKAYEMLLMMNDSTVEVETQ